ncbi:MAG: lipoate--protein ligase family protein [Anaerolineae bacterium]|nr:lipoate--protein ligase family protein [Anaerolineae bacterium]MBL6966044.1 lipoate--protein ligase family protein [Anaerolineales bacterium]
MDYYFLDSVSWQHSQALYHAAAYLGREALFILRPNSPYVCIGFHQDAEQEIDLAFARANKIPVFRREVGGGAVYLDGEQLFYQLVIRSDRPAIPRDKGEFYRQFLQPVVDVYRAFGVDAAYKPVNDIIANGRKISGNGAAEIEGMTILVGNFIMDFNYEMMSKCLRVPDEKFRDKVFKTLSENLSTIQRETGSIPATANLAAALAAAYEPLLGKLQPKELDAELIAKADELFAEMYTDEWLLANDRRRPDAKQVKIREGVYVLQKVVKLPGGLVRANAVVEDGTLHEVHLSGDFFFYPSNALQDLEKALEGTSADPQSLTHFVKNFYTQRAIVTPGIAPQQLAEVFAA